MTEREMFEASFKRPQNFFHLSPQEQWEIDKRLGILDWEGRDLSEEDLRRFKEHYEYEKQKCSHCKDLGEYGIGKCRIASVYCDCDIGRALRYKDKKIKVKDKPKRKISPEEVGKALAANKESKAKPPHPL